MATYTPNLNLGKPAVNDQVKDFLALFNANMDILDQGGGGSGHTIEDGSGTAMTARANLQFVNCTSVTDDAVNDRTVVTVLPFYITGDTTVGFTPHY